MLAHRQIETVSQRVLTLTFLRATTRLAGPGLVLACLVAGGPAFAQDAPLPAPLPAPLAAPQQAETFALGDWSLDVFRLPGTNEALCVATRTYPNGDRFGLILGEKGRGLIYGRPGLQVKEGTSMDFGFSVDERPPLRLPGTAYDPSAIMSAPLPSPEGEKLYEIFAKGGKVIIGSNQLKVRSEAMDLTGSDQVIKALDRCAETNAIKVVHRETAAAATPGKPSTGASVAGSTFDAAPGATTAPAPAPAPTPAPAAVPEPPTATSAAIQDAISAEAKKRKAGVGYAVAVPKDVTGDKKDDIVLIFVLLEGEIRKGYATVLKATGKDKYTALNTVPLGGVPTNDPPIFTKTGMLVGLEAGQDGKARDVEIVITAKSLTVQKK